MAEQPDSDPAASGRRARRPHGRPTIRDVARLAKVSVGTVSKALNNNGSLRQETRERVIAVARELGFRPNDLAQSLHRGQTFTVGLISTDSFGRFTIPIMEGLEECLTDSRIAVFMCNATDDPEREAQHVDRCSPSGSTASSSPPAAPTGARGSGRAARPARALRLLAERRPRRLLPDPRRRGRRGARRRPPRPARPAGGSPTSPGRSGSRRCGSAATAIRKTLADATASPSRTASTCPASGRRAGAARRWRSSSAAGRRRPTRSSAATTRSPAASADALRERGVVVPGRRCRSSASTTGRSSPRRRGRRSPRST